jgi:uncharacterized membrane protein YecN with MAPEG domain
MLRVRSGTETTGEPIVAPEITGLYAIPLALLMTALSIYVIMMRAKSGVALLDGGNEELLLRMRRHGNFIETVPMALLLIALAEMLGAPALWLHLAGALLLAGRITHAVGLSGTKAATPGRIAGGIATTSATLIAAGTILVLLMTR